MQAATTSASNLTTTAADQTASFTFSAHQGTSISVALSAMSVSPASATSIGVSFLRPDGSSYWNTGCTVSDAGCLFPLFNLPQTGTYTVILTPQGGAQLVAITATSIPPVTAALTVNSPLNVNLATPGQMGQYSFSASQGQSLTLNMANIVSSSGNGSINVKRLYNSNGTFVGSTSNSSSGVLESAGLGGRYLHRAGLSDGGVCDHGATPACMAATGSLAVDGSTSSIVTVAPGQYAYKSLNLTAGRELQHCDQQHRAQSRCAAGNECGAL